MKLFKSALSIIIALTMLAAICLTTFADSESYTITIPDGFTESVTDGQATWTSADGSIIISLALSPNTSNVKVNPSEAGESYLNALENEMKTSVPDSDEVQSEIIALTSGVMELPGHDAIRLFMRTDYTFENGEMSVYQLCYLFETQNYIHSFIVMGDSDVSEFADELIKTVTINDEAIALRNTEDSGFLGGIFDGVVGGVIKGALIGVLVGGALALINKFSKKKTNEDGAAPADPQEAEPTPESETNE
ncbi:MAG: hypothetical protein IKY44_01505 [Clostridia bacterium]|nr:hypothetical protein [Clostridia bacterium]